MSQPNSLKDVFVENLRNILNAEAEVRTVAEQQLAMLETNEDYALSLMEISLSKDIDFSIRHLASVIFDMYIKKHWTELSDKFEAPEVSAVVKPLVREYLLKALTVTATGDVVPGAPLDHATKKLLSSFAHTLSRIAQYDWPANWPNLFPVLSEYLASGSPPAIFSTLKVFSNLSHEIIDTQIPNVAPVLLPQMLNIFTCATGQFPPRARSSAIKIFGTISETIMLMSEYQKDAIKLYLAPHIPRYAEAVIAVLMVPDNSTADVDIGLKKDIINGLTQFLKSCRKHFKAYLPKIMELIWHGLTTSANIYVQRIVNSNTYDDLGGGGEYSDSADDSDGEATGFEAYIYAIIDFVMTIFESTRYRELIKPVLPDLLYFIIFYIQITDDQAEMWEGNLDRFIEDDDIDSTGYSVRISAQDLILNLSRDMTTLPEGNPKKDDELFKVAFLQAIKRHFAHASEMEKADPPKPWWKVVESCLYSLGMIAPTIIYTINSGTALANEYKAILDTVLSNMTQLNQPFLAGRAIWTASRFSPIMNDQSLDNFLKLTASLLSMVDQPILRIYALKSTYYFCDNVQVNQKVPVIKPYLTQFLQGLVSIGIQSNSDTLYLVLQTIAMILKLDNEFTASVAGSICSLATSALLQCPDDPTIFDVTLDIYEELFKIESCHNEVAQRLLPTVVSIISASTAGSAVQVAFKDGTGSDVFRSVASILTLQPQFLDVLASLVRQAPAPLSEVLIQQVYPALMRCLQNASSEDTAILQNGSECIRHFVAKGAEQLARFVDPVTNQNGIVLALNLCNVLLNPKIPESCSTFIGRLIITLILKANPLLGNDNIQHLLRSTVVKLNTSKELILTQSLILVFAHLIYSDMATILVFLHSLPAPDGTKSALEFVLDRWLSIQLYFTGYENKASTVALCRLFQHSLDSGVGGSVGGELALINLHRIEVNCEDMASNSGSAVPEVTSGSVRTRSKTSQAGPMAGRKVPSTVKMLKLLLNELNHLRELKEAAGARFESDDSTDDADDTEDDDSGVIDGPSGRSNSMLANLLKKQDVIDLTDLLLDGDEELEESADEILSEEIAAIDLEEALRSVLRNFKCKPVVGEFLCHLTTSERELLNGL